MISGIQKAELEKQFRDALAAILDKLGSGELVRTDFDSYLKTKLHMNPTGQVRLEYEAYDSALKACQQQVKNMSQLTGEEQGKLEPLLRQGALEHVGQVEREIFDMFLEKMQKSDGRFPLARGFMDIPSAVVGITFLEAESIQEMTRGVNLMLEALGIEKRVTLPPEQGTGLSR